MGLRARVRELGEELPTAPLPSPIKQALPGAQQQPGPSSPGAKSSFFLLPVWLPHLSTWLSALFAPPQLVPTSHPPPGLPACCLQRSTLGDTSKVLSLQSYYLLQICTDKHYQGRIVAYSSPGKLHSAKILLAKPRYRPLKILEM